MKCIVKNFQVFVVVKVLYISFYCLICNLIKAFFVICIANATFFIKNVVRAIFTEALNCFLYFSFNRDLYCLVFSCQPTPDYKLAIVCSFVSPIYKKKRGVIL